jgi:hypothetical protein
MVITQRLYLTEGWMTIQIKHTTFASNVPRHLLFFSILVVFLEDIGASSNESYSWREDYPMCSFAVIRGVCKFASLA